MDVIIGLANKLFKPILDMGGPIIMLIILTVLALLLEWNSPKHLKVVSNLPSLLLVSVAIIGMLNGAFSASLAKFVRKYWYSIEHHWRWLGTTRYNHLGICLDTLLLAHHVDCQRSDACYEENWYTWRWYLRYLALVYHRSFD